MASGTAGCPDFHLQEALSKFPRELGIGVGHSAKCLDPDQTTRQQTTQLPTSTKEPSILLLWDQRTSLLSTIQPFGRDRGTLTVACASLILPVCSSIPAARCLGPRSWVKLWDNSPTTELFGGQTSGDHRRAETAKSPISRIFHVQRVAGVNVVVTAAVLPPALPNWRWCGRSLGHVSLSARLVAGKE
ncbi:hypothetical protein VTI74DRAFT_7470 [Chaetomium olivicolor]